MLNFPFTHFIIAVFNHKLETILQKQIEDQNNPMVSSSSIKSMIVTEDKTHTEPTVHAITCDADNVPIKLESMQHDLTSMKSEEIVESPPNRHVVEIAAAGDDQLLIDPKGFSDSSDTSPAVVEDKEVQHEVDEINSKEKRRKKREIERKYSIKELYETEKDFCTELSLLHDVFVNDTNAVNI